MLSAFSKKEQESVYYSVCSVYRYKLLIGKMVSLRDHYPTLDHLFSRRYLVDPYHSFLTPLSGDVLRHLLACMVHGDSSEDLKTKAKRALKAILAKCTHLAALQPLLKDAPMKVQKYVLRQFAQLLPHDVEARRAFVQVMERTSL